jgi:hypothetical protein
MNIKSPDPTLSVSTQRIKLKTRECLAQPEMVG